jgi:hypothetical protein
MFEAATVVRKPLCGAGKMMNGALCCVMASCCSWRQLSNQVGAKEYSHSDTGRDAGRPPRHGLAGAGFPSTRARRFAIAGLDPQQGEWSRLIRTCAGSAAVYALAVVARHGGDHTPHEATLFALRRRASARPGPAHAKPAPLHWRATARPLALCRGPVRFVFKFKTTRAGRSCGACFQTTLFRHINL